MAIAPPPGAATRSNPIEVTMTPERELSRLWGIPFFGIFVRWILAIPHFVVLSLLGIALYVWVFLGWIPILVNGRVPGIAVKLLTEYMQRGARVGGYTAFLMPGGYPPLEPGAPTPIDVQFNFESLEINRLWGVPVFEWFVRFLILVPHLIVLGFAAIAVCLSEIVLWIPILLLGRYPGWAASLYGGIIRYGIRVGAYMLLLPVPYPPFSFG